MFSSVELNAQTVRTEPSKSAIEQKVRKEILMLPRYELFDFIQYQVDGNTVILSGAVTNAINKSSAENVVERIEGVANVVNNIEVLPLSRFDDNIRRSLVASISRTANLSRYIAWNNPPVRLIVDGGHVTLEGSVSTKSDSNMMNIAANSVNGVFSVTNNLRIEKGS